MPNVGMSELVIILLIGLLVFGPRRLPEMARNLGKAWRFFQEESRKAREVLTTSLDEETRVVTDTMSEAGIIDRPESAPQRAVRRTTPPSPEEIDRAAAIEPVAERALEDT